MLMMQVHDEQKSIPTNKSPAKMKKKNVHMQSFSAPINKTDRETEQKERKKMTI